MGWSYASLLGVYGDREDPATVPVGQVGSTSESSDSRGNSVATRGGHRDPRSSGDARRGAAHRNGLRI